ncbi:MAG: L,D-transpeptidase family protein [Lachnospiraceae bacterium]|nr:L,D-transpeptidase family protein [Lachnospiraceae bacterium]
MPDETKRKSKMEIAAETSKKSREMHRDDLSRDDVEKILNEAKKTVDDVNKNNQPVVDEKKSEEKPQKVSDKEKEDKKPSKSEKTATKKDDNRSDDHKEENKDSKKAEINKDSKNKEPKKEDYKSEDKKTVDSKNEKKSEDKKETKSVEEVKKEDKKLVDDAVIIKEKKALNVGRFFKVAGFVLVGLLALGYGLGCVYFSNHFQANTKVNGIDASYLTGSEILPKLNEKANDYCLTVSGRGDVSFDIKGDDIDFMAEPAENIEQVAIDQKYYRWPLSFIKNSDLELSYSVKYDSEKLGRCLATSKLFDGKVYREPKDAFIEYKDGGFVITPEDKGTAPVKADLYDAVGKAVASMDDSISLENADVYMQPKILSDNEELVKRCDALAAYNECSLTYMLGSVEYEIPPEKLTEALYFDNGGHLSIDSDKVKLFVSQLASEFNTANTTRDFVTHKGYKVYVKGPYGYTIDEEKEFESIYEQLRLRKKVTREPIYTTHGYARKGVKNDVGNSYVEIDLEAQHLYLFLDGQLYLESDVVTGNVSHKCATPPGIYGVYYKKTPAILRGDDYESHVTYWMPFNKGIGLHDATWRGRFGGNIYLYNGSHGCVNLPLSKAKEIYQVVKVGMPVILYNSSSYVRQ